MAVRQDRVESIINKNISEIIQFELKDPSVGFVTITDVKMTNDYSYAKVYVSFLGQTNRQKKGLETLNRAKGYIRSLLSKKISIRKVPELIFVLDTTLEKANKIESIIKKTKEK